MPRPFHVGMAHDRRHVFFGQLRARQLHIAETVKGELGAKRFCALHRERIRRLCRAQIFRIKIPVYQNFGELQGKRSLEMLGGFYLDHARHVLLEIVHKLARGGMYDFLYGQFFDIAHRLANLRHKRALVEHDFAHGERF